MDICFLRTAWVSKRYTGWKPNVSHLVMVTTVPYARWLCAVRVRRELSLSRENWQRKKCRLWVQYPETVGDVGSSLLLSVELEEHRCKSCSCEHLLLICLCQHAPSSWKCLAPCTACVSLHINESRIFCHAPLYTLGKGCTTPFGFDNTHLNWLNTILVSEG